MAIKENSAKVGDNFEELFFTWCDKVGIPFRKEKTLTNGKRRRKDKKVDTELFPKDNPVFVELKSRKITHQIDYRLFEDGKRHILKFHQICKMDWLIVEWRGDQNIYVAIKRNNFRQWAAKQQKNSFSYKDSLEMGEVIEGVEWLELLKKTREKEKESKKQS